MTPSQVLLCMFPSAAPMKTSGFVGQGLEMPRHNRPLLFLLILVDICVQLSVYVFFLQAKSCAAHLAICNALFSFGLMYM
jgi:hypothetical protein